MLQIKTGGSAKAGEAIPEIVAGDPIPAAPHEEDSPYAPYPASDYKPLPRQAKK